MATDQTETQPAPQVSEDLLAVDEGEPRNLRAEATQTFLIATAIIAVTALLTFALGKTKGGATFAGSGVRSYVATSVVEVGGQKLQTLELSYDFVQQLSRMVTTFEGGQDFGGFTIERVEAIATATELFSRIPEGVPIGDDLPPGAAWIRFTLTPEQSDLFLGGIDSPVMPGADPARWVEQLSEVAKVAELGKQTIDGVETTELRVRFDNDQIKENFEATDAAHILAQVSPVTSMRVFVGTKDGLPYRVVVQQGKGAAATVSTTTFSAYEQRPNIVPPPSAEVIPAPEGLSVEMFLGGSTSGRSFSGGPDPQPSASPSP